jgi:putative drug exporter of the RND superfamily
MALLAPTAQSPQAAKGATGSSSPIVDKGIAMFRLLGNLVSRPPAAIALIAVWIVILVAVGHFAPDWEKVTVDGEVEFLPADSPSVKADAAFADAFPLQYSSSNIAIVLSRTDHELTDADRDFVRDKLKKGLQKIAADTANEKGEGPVVSIHTVEERGAGALLASEDKKAMLVVVELKTAFQSAENPEVIEKVEKLLAKIKADVPAGLKISLGGSATAGRDLDFAEEETARNIELWTIGIVIVLLLLIYRAPLVALIPLLTVFVSVSIAVPILAWLAELRILAPSRDLRIFIVVLAYGAGVDYCLFLIARFREELDSGVDSAEAIRRSLAGVGGPIAASALTVICGIGMMAFAQFKKIHEAGLGIPLALLVPLLGTLTFAAPLLRLAGPAAFWPRHLARSGEHRSSWWEWVGQRIVQHPWAVWGGTLAVMLPFAILGVVMYGDTNYNPLSDLPAGAPTRQADAEVAKHFPAGSVGPVTILLKNDNVDFSTDKGAAVVAAFTKNLHDKKSELTLADVRSIAQPLGTTAPAREYLKRFKATEEDADSLIRDDAQNFYVSQTEKSANHVTRIDVVFAADPLTRGAIDMLDQLEKAVPEALPPELSGSSLAYVGPTTSLRDLSVVKQRDQHLIQMLVPAVVFVLLLILLRRTVVSVYLVLSVIFSYLCTFGVTWLVFRMLGGDEFLGLDWKVPIFLFTILVAVGEDYNIFLVTRVHEEEEGHGPLGAIPVALARTGRVISSCGILMAGTFASLLSGSVRAMIELGFALSFGVLLETLVVRPILVPAFLVIMQKMFPRPERPEAKPIVIGATTEAALRSIPAQPADRDVAVGQDR